MKTFLLFILLFPHFSSVIIAQIPPPIDVSKRSFINNKLRTDSTFSSFSHVQTKTYESVNSVRSKRIKTEGIFLLEQYNQTLSELLLQNRDSRLEKKDEIVRLENNLELLQSRLKISGSVLDSINHEFNKDLILVRKANLFNFNKDRSQAFFDLVYDNDEEVSLLNNANFNSFKKSGTISTEILSGYLSVLRVSISVMTLSNSVENTNSQLIKSQEAFQRFLTTGGNLRLNFEYPLVYLHSRNGQFNLVGRLTTKGNADFPQLGTVTNQFSGSIAVGSSFYADAALSNNFMRFYITYDSSINYSSIGYRENLFIKNPVYLFGQLTIGAIIKDTLIISFILNTSSSESSLNTNKVVFGGEVIN